MKIDLCNSFSEQGHDFASFCDAVESMSESTACIVYDTSLISLLSFIDEDEEAFHFFDHRKKIKRDLKKYRFEEKEIPEGIVDEMRDARLAIMLREKDSVSVNFVAPGVINMLGERVGIKGECMNRPSLKRDAYVSELKDLLKKQSLSVIVRKNDGYTKIFAFHSKDYPYIPQTVLRDIVNTISRDEVTGMGKVVTRYWDMNHSITNILVEFPDMALEFKDYYNLPEEVVPGVILSTSDVGDCSVTAKSCWRIRHSLVVQDVYKRIHRGSISVNRIVNDIDKSVFSKFRILPARLCELLSIDIADPKECITRAFEELNVNNIICERNRNKIIGFLVSEINPGMKYTAYDIATSIMDLGGRIEGLSTHSLDCLQKLLLKTPYLKWEDFSSTTGVVVTA